MWEHACVVSVRLVVWIHVHTRTHMHTHTFTHTFMCLALPYYHPPKNKPHHHPTHSYTTQDGETNLKIKKPVDLRDAILDSPANIAKLRGVLQVELPSQNLHHLKATFHLKSGVCWCVLVCVGVFLVLTWCVRVLYYICCIKHVFLFCFCVIHVHLQSTSTHLQSTSTHPHHLRHNVPCNTTPSSPHNTHSNGPPQALPHHHE